MKKEVSRRIFLGSALGVSASLALAACAPGTGGGGGNSINLYTWADYDDPEVLTDYTSANGPAIKLGSYDSNEELIAKLLASKGTAGYDIVVPTLSFVPQMIELGLLQELDHAKLPNLKNVDPAYLDSELDPGNKYSVPKAFGATGYAYDTTVITRELTSWADFFDAAQKEAAGSTSMLNDANEILWAYFFSTGDDINTGEPGLLEKARAFLVDNIAPNLQAFESYPSSTIAQSGVVLAQAWGGDARRGLLENPEEGRYKFVKPSEGAAFFTDNWCIPTGAPKADAAIEFINYVLDVDVSLKELLYIGYNTAITGIGDLALQEDLPLPEIIFYDEEETAKLVTDIVPESQEARVAILAELTAAAGQG